jgi:hypothetical protein
MHPACRLPVFIGAQLVDWAFFALLLTGVEKMRVTPGISVMNPMDLYHMPYTHSLLGGRDLCGGIWHIGLAGDAKPGRRDSRRLWWCCHTGFLTCWCMFLT